jgi:hypothetical protein
MIVFLCVALVLLIRRIFHPFNVFRYKKFIQPKSKHDVLCVVISTGVSRLHKQMNKKYIKMIVMISSQEVKVDLM